MSDSEFQILLEHAKRVTMTPEHKEAQRRSFAFGNANIENEAITREMVDKAAESIRTSGESPSQYNDDSC